MAKTTNAPARINWTSVNAQLPDNAEDVLLSMGDDSVWMGNYEDGKWFALPDWEDAPVTHWAPVPLTPREGCFDASASQPDNVVSVTEAARENLTRIALRGIKPRKTKKPITPGEQYANDAMNHFHAQMMADPEGAAEKFHLFKADNVGMADTFRAILDDFARTYPERVPPPHQPPSV